MMGSAERRSWEVAIKVARGGALLLDVRTPAEFDAKHLPGAQNIPVQELSHRLAQLGPAPREIVVYCRSGVRSAVAAQLLTAAGHQVFDLGSMENWPTH